MDGKQLILDGRAALGIELGSTRIKAVMTDYDGKDYKLNYLYKAGEDGKLASTGNGLCDRERLIRCGYESMMTGKRSA